MLKTKDGDAFYSSLNFFGISLGLFKISWDLLGFLGISWDFFGDFFGIIKITNTSKDFQRFLRVLNDFLTLRPEWCFLVCRPKGGGGGVFATGALKAYIS